ncbi:hypothetical protein HHL11_33500 [Ramlibacter sp. G-1-2-2]|uniref:Uncharacterized protein n=1 Tax=Ramlibacter agri TaxID=2728837 RepID=A0A848HGZ2_9BURK|nr:hypothetical protein [Ramlibacter agri]NML48699.1 hypothetical protein [Ramlibacter agri]
MSSATACWPTCSAIRTTTCTPWKPFPELEPLPGAQLPTGYSGCLLLATMPPLWFAVMHPRMRATTEPVAAL